MFFKKKDTVAEQLKKEYTLDLAEFLVRHGLKPKDAYKLAEDFWKKHFDKIKEIIG